MAGTRDTTALLLIDLQPDFMPGGALPVDEGDEIVAPIQRLIDTHDFGLLAATQDWHLPDHVSFASNHAGRSPFDVIDLYGHEQVLWPDHCVQGTAGARLHDGIDWDRVAVIIRKGMDVRTDSYSGFRNNWNPDGQRPSVGLGGYLHDRGVEAVMVCGLARDYCVKWTAQDAAEAGFATYVIWDLTRPVDPASNDRVRQELVSKGVRIVTADSLAR